MAGRLRVSRARLAIFVTVVLAGGVSTSVALSRTRKASEEMDSLHREAATTRSTIEGLSRFDDGSLARLTAERAALDRVPVAIMAEQLRSKWTVKTEARGSGRLWVFARRDIPSTDWQGVLEDFARLERAVDARWDFFTASVNGASPDDVALNVEIRVLEPARH